MKNLIFILFVAIVPFFASAQSSWSLNSEPENTLVNNMSGPRFGITYVTEGSTAQFLNRMHEMDSTGIAEFGSIPFTYTTQYGWQYETRFADTGGPIVGLVEWIALIGGMEKGLFLPSVSSLVGIRGAKGFEFATGPNISASGLSFVFAIGYNYKKGDLNLPINIAIVPDKISNNSNSALADILNATDDFQEVRLNNTGARVTVSVGFNLRESK